MEKHYTLNEVREIANIGRSTIYRHIDKGKLKAVKIGRDWRVKEKDLLDYLGDNNDCN